MGLRCSKAGTRKKASRKNRATSTPASTRRATSSRPRTPRTSSRTSASSHTAAYGAGSATAHIKAGVSAEGRLWAYDAQSWGTGGAGATSNFPLPYIYDFPNRRRTHKDVYINAGQQRAMRAPGHPQGCFLTEILMDELADLVKMDPVAFRVKNLPPKAPNAMWAEYYELGAKRFGWEKRHPTGDQTPGPIKTGMGVSAHRTR